MKERSHPVTRIKVKLTVPVFDVDVWVIVSKDIFEERKKLDHWFGPAPVADYEALASWRGHRFALFFKPESVSYQTVSHEAFHLSHRISEWKGIKFDNNHHEPTALLHGYLMKKLTEILGL